MLLRSVVGYGVDVGTAVGATYSSRPELQVDEWVNGVTEGVSKSTPIC
jgi:hypothetical protein